jgi:UDP-N-acetylglucosamine--N-acetylmuramyl-(pentapeptide) pyrophosphoryl-undecaprenol N-acetylglucosamine transferase
MGESTMTIVIAAGGTGGHLYPAVALAREFLCRDPSTNILFVGTVRGVESRVLAHEGFELAMITAKPVMGKGPLDIIKGVLSLPIGIWQSLNILKRRQADLVIGVGGYTSPAMLVAAALKGIARVILEPNAYPGLANKVIAPLAQRIFLAFESAGTSFDRRKVRVVGTPIRREFLVRPDDSVSTKQDGRHLLIFGGSQGARAINSAVLEGLPLLSQRLLGLTITHQTGEGDFERVSAVYRTLGIQATVVPFLYDMAAVLRTADLVVARAGAMTIAELTACGKAAILIPLPTAIYDHQMKNARAMEAAGGAIVLPQAELTGVKLGEMIETTLSDPQRLGKMQRKSFEMRRIDAGEVIVGECYALMGVTYDINQSTRATGG